MWPRLSPHSKALAYVALCPLLYQHRYRLLFPLRAALSPSCSWAEPLWAGPLVASVSASVSAPRYRIPTPCLTLGLVPLGLGALLARYCIGGGRLVRAGRGFRSALSRPASLPMGVAIGGRSPGSVADPAAGSDPLPRCAFHALPLSERPLLPGPLAQRVLLSALPSLLCAIAPHSRALCVAMLSARPPGGSCYEFGKCGAVCNFSLTRVVPILPKYHLWEFTRLGQTENCKIVFVQQTS